MSYVGSWGSAMPANAAVSASGAMCGTNIINDLILEAFPRDCAREYSQTGCENMGCVYRNYSVGPSVYWRCEAGADVPCSSMGQGTCQQDSECVWDSTALWCYNRHVKFADLYDGCYGKGPVQCPSLPLSRWDGTLPSGQAVFDPDRVSGAAFRPLPATVTCSATTASNVLPLVHAGCDQRVDVLPGTVVAVALYLPQLSASLPVVMDAIMQFAVGCSLDSLKLGPLSNDQFSTRFR